MHTVPTYRATTFQKSLDDLREHRVLRFDRNSIDRIEVGWDGGAVVLEKKDGAWRVTSPLEGPADDDTVDKLLSDASYLRADGFIDAPPSDDAMDLAKPEVTLALSGKAPVAGQPPTSFTLKLGGPLPTNPKRRALRTGDGGVYEIATERIAEFPRDITAYRFKEVSRFSPTDANRIELTFQQDGGKPPVVVALDRGEAGWTSKAEPLVPGKAARLAAELSHLRAAGIVSDHATEAELKQHGLAPPQVTVRVLGTKPASGQGPASGGRRDRDERRAGCRRQVLEERDALSSWARARRAYPWEPCRVARAVCVERNPEGCLGGGKRAGRTG